MRERRFSPARLRTPRVPGNLDARSHPFDQRRGTSIGARACLGHKSRKRERPMMRPKTASLAILGTAAIAISALAAPAMAEGKMGKSAKYTQAQTKQSHTLAKGQRHATYHSQRIRRANAAMPDERMYRGPAGPG